jgi:hypothetical protein
MQLIAMLFVAGGFILGTVVGALAFLLRRFIRTDIGRIRLLLILALVSVFVTFLIGAGVIAISGETAVQCDTLFDFARCTNLLDSEGVRAELWLRSMVPPTMRATCMLGNLDACFVLRSNPQMISLDVLSYVTLWIGTFLAAVVALLVGRFAMRNHTRFVH